MKKAVKQVAKTIAQEPFEILKQAGKQVVGGETLKNQTPQRLPQSQSPGVSPELREKIKEKDTRLIEALEKEIEDIKAQKKLEEQKRIEKAPPQEAPEPLVEPSTKRSRKLFSFGAKTQAERQKTRVEKPLPPSG
ncbi:MAG: hypothetical protein UX25_C0032G0003 [Candidatus Woesebacteria bacterium GW2011_GWC2_45_9]|uniref:Uncharacterized protein n=2 Tax=Microgenomates group TaxID=1794810 RepID=A0A0G1R694_9BACT|nr:MAG: hypothetical protein UW61_C0007G0003 [Candidatus Curtissbacteria bacterium GW2011_GWC1_44_33]KKU16455.1 MAG: hypothetical protein UX25_C0032G0003 [Candidatus Woesebacteria bacterium GW2011_GWC2_45_9]